MVIQRHQYISLAPTGFIYEIRPLFDYLRSQENYIFAPFRILDLLFNRPPFFFLFFSTSIISSQDLIMADEASNPLFLHYGKCLGAILVSQPLVSENYKVKGSLFLFWIIFFNPLNTLASRAQNPSHGRMNVKLGVELLNLKFLSCTWIITRTQKTRWVMWSLIVFNLDYDLTRYKSATIFNWDFFR